MAVGDTKRTICLLDARLAGPVASIWSSHLHRQRRDSEGNLEQNVPNLSKTCFIVSRTEDAMDSVIPCAAEEFFRPMLQNRFSNPAKLQFSYRTAQ
eukprot:gene12944-13072_t